VSPSAIIIAHFSPAMFHALLAECTANPVARALSETLRYGVKVASG
jgi:hypothetical protein